MASCKHLPGSSSAVLVTIARAIYPVRLGPDNPNYRFMSALAKELGRLELVVKAPGSLPKKLNYTNGRLLTTLLPSLPNKLLDYLLFVPLATLRALAIGLKLPRKVPVVLNASEPIAGGPAVLIAGLISRRPTTCELQGELLKLSPEHFSAWGIGYRRQITKLVLRSVGLVRCVSHKVAHQAKVLGIDESKLRIIPTRCDTTLFNPSRWSRWREVIRRELGWKREKVAVWVGRMVSHKAPEVALRAWAEVCNALPEARLLMVGDGPMRGQVIRLVRELGLEEQVCLYGRAPYTHIPGLLASGDIFISSSLDEGLPRAVLEAMAMELPVVATAVGGHPEIVEDGISGVLVPPGDAKALAAAIISVLTNSTGKAMGRRGRQLVLTRYEFQVQLARYKEFVLEAGGVWSRSE